MSTPHAGLPKGLYAICDDSPSFAHSISAQAEAFIAEGGKLLQLRFKHSDGQEALAVAKRVVEASKGSGVVVLINDRIDLALLSGADGVHLGDSDIPVREARRLLGPHKIIGRTARTLDGIRRAEAEGADYVGLGPIFPSATKKVQIPCLGLEGLREFCQQSPLPVVAISGIGLHNIKEVARTGAHAAALISDLWNANNVAERLRGLTEAFEAGQLVAHAYISGEGEGL